MHLAARMGLVLALSLWAATTHAAPPLIHYQGQALDAAGDPIDVPIDVEIAIFDDALAGTELWSETHSGVLPVEGDFALVLGSLTPITPDVFAGDAGRWFEVTLDGETLAPRQQVASVPYALHASCIPGDVLGCYTGDPATLDVGLCKAGSRVCSPTGTWGDCSGEVLPATELCVGFEDESCDGVVNEGCPVCGNGSLEDPEECDDGNLAGGDGCSAACLVEACGNGSIETGEQCDDGNLLAGDGCDGSCQIEQVVQEAPPDQGTYPFAIQLDSTASILDFVSFPGGDQQDRVSYSVSGMNPNPVFSGGRARLVISASCFGNNTDEIEFFTLGQTFSCGQTIVDREVTADTDTGLVTITAVGGQGTYVQWVLTGTATRTN